MSVVLCVALGERRGACSTVEQAAASFSSQGALDWWWEADGAPGWWWEADGGAPGWSWEAGGAPGWSWEADGGAPGWSWEPMAALLASSSATAGGWTLERLPSGTPDRLPPVERQ